MDLVGHFLLLQELRLFILLRLESSSNFQKNNYLTVSKPESSVDTDGHPMLSSIYRPIKLSWRMITHMLGKKKGALMMILKVFSIQAVSDKSLVRTAKL